MKVVLNCEEGLWRVSSHEFLAKDQQFGLLSPQDRDLLDLLLAVKSRCLVLSEQRFEQARSLQKTSKKQYLLCLHTAILTTRNYFLLNPVVFLRCSLSQEYSVCSLMRYGEVSTGPSYHFLCSVRQRY